MSATAMRAPSFGGEAGPDVLPGYLETLSLIERLHRLLLDVVKDEFERRGEIEINAVQALLVFNIGTREMTAGELKSRGYYQGSNVSYNLKKLVEAGYVEHRRCRLDRRAVRIRLTDKGVALHDAVDDLFRRHAGEFAVPSRPQGAGLEGLNRELRRLERYWSEEIRYTY
jgi:DNA-binding MarR family transcriptional regulator